MAKEAIELFPTSAMAYNNYGYAQIHLKQYQEAEIYLKKAIEINPIIRQAHVNLSWLYLEMERFEDAAKVAEQTIKLHPNAAMVFNIWSKTSGVIGIKSSIKNKC
jgi:tetratricopeptide (TPR) repeat protein